MHIISRVMYIIICTRIQSKGNYSFSTHMQLLLEQTVTSLRQEMESLEVSLTQTRQEETERSSQSTQTEKELSQKLEQLQRELSSERSERQREREETSQQLKRVSLTSSQAQQVIQAKGKVANLTANKSTLYHSVLIFASLSCRIV